MRILGIKRINQTENQNRIIGEWKSEKGRGNECVVTSRNDQLFLTLKYKRDVIYQGCITEKKGANTNGRRAGDNSNVYCKIDADTIIINVNVFQKESSSSINAGGYWSGNSGHTVEINYRFTYENGKFVLYVKKDGKETDKVVFRKTESK